MLFFHHCLSSKILISLVWLWMYTRFSFWNVLVLYGICYVSGRLPFVEFLLLGKNAFFHAISFFPNWYWLRCKSIFGSWIIWCSIGYCFYMGINRLFMFTIRSMPLRYLSMVKLVSLGYHIFIAYIVISNWAPVITCSFYYVAYFYVDVV